MLKKSYLPKFFFFLALFSLICTVFVGFLLVFYYTKSGYTFLKICGITFRELRPVHTAFAMGWLFTGSIGVVYMYLYKNSGNNTNDYLLPFLHFFLWLLCGIFILVTLVFGKLSGREYVGYHPLFSFFLLIGWFFFLLVFLRKHINRFFFIQPIYIYFWFCGILYFVYSFIENHTWLLPNVWRLPIVDLQLQWKSLGSLVASFNMLIYGSFAYLSKLLGDEKYVYSNTTFMLFGVGLLNSLTNYTHHTYHLPQLDFVKWFGFIVSMIEIFIFLKVTNDVLYIFKQRSTFNYIKDDVVYFFINSVKWWSFINLFISILISVPFLNSIIHGTQVVFAHSMGSMIGIDTMVLFSVFSFVILHNKSFGITFLYYLIYVFNFFLFLFVLFFCFVGLKSGISVYLGYSVGVHNVISYVPHVFIFISFGLFITLFFISIIFCINCYTCKNF